MNNEIQIQLIGGVPRVNSRLIAERFNNQHKAVYQLIKIYQGDFRDFGILPFQMEKIRGKRGRPRLYCFLKGNLFGLQKKIGGLSPSDKAKASCAIKKRIN